MKVVSGGPTTYQMVNGHALYTVNVLAAAPDTKAREAAAVKDFMAMKIAVGDS